MRWMLYIAILGSLAVGAALAASSIDPNHKYAWCENVGWTNWRDANSAADGVEVRATYLSGSIWAENAGWVNIGDGTPGDGTHYANVDGSDFGINIDDNGDLFGMGWGENVGWINFDTRDKAEDRARISCDEGRLYGYVWGENIGWINLDEVTYYVAGDFSAACGPPPCGDYDGDGDVDLGDFGNHAVPFTACLQLSGPGQPPIIPLCATVWDCDMDSDVDLMDFMIFQQDFTGPR